MKQELTNIFVPYQVAKLAFEKGFIEWCAGINNKKNQIMSNCESDDFNFDFKYFTDDSDGEFGIPTHLQLIVWLKRKHDIDVTMQVNGFWIVLDAFGRDTYFEYENEFEINQALEVALNLLPDFQHNKQEYL